MSKLSIRQQFILTLASANLYLKDDLVIGRLSRCHVGHKASGKNDGTYIYFENDAIAYGGYQNHQDGRGWIKWRSDAPYQRQLVNNPFAGLVETELAELARKEKAAWRAKKIWEAGRELPSHPYLITKGVAMVGGLRVGSWRKGDLHWDQALLIPLIDGECFTSLQAINLDGTKDLLWGGQKMGSFFPLAPLKQGCRLVICEGYATAWSASQIFGRVGVMAVDAGNLASVAIRLKHLYKADILIGADNDPAGIKGAEGAVRATGCQMVVPELEGQDWNDVNCSVST